jgi:hypothetical protein
VQSDDELEAWVIKNVDTGYHPVGTCRMSTDRNDGVVDGPPASAPPPPLPAVFYSERFWTVHSCAHGFETLE